MSAFNYYLHNRIGAELFHAIEFNFSSLFEYDERKFEPHHRYEFSLQYTDNNFPFLNEIKNCVSSDDLYYKIPYFIAQRIVSELLQKFKSQLKFILETKLKSEAQYLKNQTYDLSDYSIVVLSQEIHDDISLNNQSSKYLDFVNNFSTSLNSLKSDASSRNFNKELQFYNDELNHYDQSFFILIHELDEAKIIFLPHKPFRYNIDWITYNFNDVLINETQLPCLNIIFKDVHTLNLYP
jgi:hypothetical protein